MNSRFVRREFRVGAAGNTTPGGVFCATADTEAQMPDIESLKSLHSNLIDAEKGVNRRGQLGEGLYDLALGPLRSGRPGCPDLQDRA
jgi:hypothetical protein